MPNIRNKMILRAIILAAMIALFVFHALSLSFTQDDAYISFRYVKNFLDGNGLVFNSGERVEGYTNFFFVVILIFFGALGLNYILISKIIGVASGGVIIILVYLLMRKVNDNKDSPINLLPCLLLVANSSFAYWSISGLETTFFTMLAVGAIYLSVTNSGLWPIIAALATLTRPEGGMIFVLILAFRFVSGQTVFKEAVKNIGLYAFIVAPHLVFRILYYGDWLPNPFYAKTSMSLDSISTGLDYIWRYMTMYGWYGVILVVPMLFVFKIKRIYRMLAVIVGVYIVYIISVGGDVLYGGRFIIAIIPLIYILFARSLYRLLSIVINAEYWRQAVSITVFVSLAALTFWIPKNWLGGIRRLEIGLTDKMTLQANFVKSSGRTDLVIACSTIGAFSYYSDQNVIDMLGLTDREIAKNPEPITGVEATWKEKNYNIPYLMKREPDLILFSTGLKPSAPAERALFLSSKFRNGYYPIYHQNNGLWTIYKKRIDLPENDEYYSNSKFVNYFHDALNNNRNENYDAAYRSAQKSIETGPPEFYLPLTLMANIDLNRGNVDNALRLMKTAFEYSDGRAIMVSFRMAEYYERAGDTARANFHAENIRKYNRIQ